MTKRGATGSRPSADLPFSGENFPSNFRSREGHINISVMESVNCP